MLSIEKPELFYGWNLLEDTRWAAEDYAFRNVLHVFCSEWLGIRAAAGNLPGQKLAISCELSSELVPHIGNQIATRGFSKIVLHGLSTFMERLAYHLSDWGHSDQLYIVMHASPVHWHEAFDRKQAFTALRLAGEGKIRRVHFLKRGFDFPVDRLFKPMLFNRSATGVQKAIATDMKPLWTVLVPGKAQWSKNPFAQMIASVLNDSVDRVLVYATGTESLPAEIRSKIRQINFNPETKFDNYRLANLALNASTVDCHPMINVEAQSVGIPCLRGQLFLDALEHHPYVHLTTVRDAASIQEISSAIDRLRAVSAAELFEMTIDYQRMTDEVSRQRYGEFLEL
jgi:hypothetical protein